MKVLNFDLESKRLELLNEILLGIKELKDNISELTDYINNDNAISELKIKSISEIEDKVNKITELEDMYFSVLNK